MLRSFKFAGLGVVIVSIAACAGVGCSSSTSSTASGGDGGAAEAGSDSATEDSGDSGDSGAVVVNSCIMFVDRSATSASRTITWDFSVSTAPERCMTIKAGEVVTFMGDFTVHPLLAGGGDKPNPVSNADPSTGAVTFPKAGLYGFMCGNHPSMVGAINVTE